eukprot:5529027-Pyramimonas_sp.AAC.2
MLPLVRLVICCRSWFATCADRRSILVTILLHIHISDVAKRRALLNACRDEAPGFTSEISLVTYRSFCHWVSVPTARTVQGAHAHL